MSDAVTAFRFEPPPWVTGGISTGDAQFLADLVQREQPRTVLELGVAAGTSSAALLMALDQLPNAKARELYSVDVRPTCYFNPQYATGAATLAMYPTPLTQWTLHVTGGPANAAVAHCAKGWAAIDLAFIDADHRHPWPLLDVLHLAPHMRPEAWIALHDIQLARLCPAFQSHGAEWLFDAWPWPTRAGTGDVENIGAIQLPHDVAALASVACQLLAHRWEAIPARTQVALSPVFASVTTALRRRVA